MSTNVIHCNYNGKLQEIFIVFSTTLINQLPRMPNLSLAAQENSYFQATQGETREGGGLI